MARSGPADDSDAAARQARPQRRRRHHKEATSGVVPDVNEIRRLREIYFGGPTRAYNAVRHTVKPPIPSRGISGRPKAHVRSRTSQGGDRTSEYVYTSARPHLEETPEGRARSMSDDGMGMIEEDEITPADSVSQAGRRRHRRHAPSSSLRAPEAKKEVSSTTRRRDSVLSSLFGRQSRAVGEFAKAELAECLACGSSDVPLKKSAKLTCDHRMCHSCLKRLFRLAVQDPAHMPPRCCTEQPIPLEHVEKLFDVRFKVLFNRKLDEYRTRNRVYCANRKCGAWIRPAHYRSGNGRRWAQCGRCNTKVCISCGMKLHKAEECPKDPEIAKIVAQGEAEGWKRCYNCQAMVELREGCNHMTCRCTAQFCMMCGLKWKTCDCPWFNTNAVPVLDHADELPNPFAYLHRQLFGQQVADRAPPRAQTYQEELQHRERQEQADADLARRMQFANLWQ